MPRAYGPHTRNSMPGRVDRGSSRRVERLSPFEDLSPLFVIIGVALLALGFCALLMYQAL
jgi:hypothetical protein